MSEDPDGLEPGDDEGITNTLEVAEGALAVEGVEGACATSSDALACSVRSPPKEASCNCMLTVLIGRNAPVGSSSPSNLVVCGAGSCTGGGS